MSVLPGADRYMRIGELARLLDVTQSTLRYWEREFGIRPARSGGQRVYSPEQVARLRMIRWLLYVELYTVAGAKRQLKLLRGFAR